MKKERDFQKLLDKIGAELIILRRQKGYSSHETFAYDHEIPRVQYWRIEKGKTNLTLRSLTNLLDIHGVSITDFFNSLEKD